MARLAERAYRRLTAPQRERARAIFLRLADAEEAAPVRRRVPLAELETERDEDAAAALAVLTESRLVTVDEGTVEVAHEALLSEWPRLRAWLADDAEGRRLHQHLIQAAREEQASGREPAELYRGARLASALDWASTHDQQLNELERAFLDESGAASEREAERQRRTNRRLRALLAGVGVLLAAAVVAGVIALERQGAQRGHRGGGTAPWRAGSHRGPPRPRGSPREHRRRPRRLGHDPLQPTRRWCATRQCSASCAATATCYWRSRSAPMGARSRSAIPGAP